MGLWWVCGGWGWLRLWVCVVGWGQLCQWVEAVGCGFVVVRLLGHGGGFGGWCAMS